MTTITYRKDTDTFKVENEGRLSFVPFNQFYSRITDQDLIDCARQAIDCAGDVVTVPNTSNARGLRPSASRKHFMQ